MNLFRVVDQCELDVAFVELRRKSNTNSNNNTHTDPWVFMLADDLLGIHRDSMDSLTHRTQTNAGSH